MNTAILLHCLRDASLENNSGPSFELHNSNYANLRTVTHMPKYSQSNDVYPKSNDHSNCALCSRVKTLRVSSNFWIFYLIYWLYTLQLFSHESKSAQFELSFELRNLNNHSNYFGPCLRKITSRCVILIVQFKWRSGSSFELHKSNYESWWHFAYTWSKIPLFEWLFKLCNLNDHSNCTLFRPANLWESKTVFCDPKNCILWSQKLYFPPKNCIL